MSSSRGAVTDTLPHAGRTAAAVTTVDSVPTIEAVLASNNVFARAAINAGTRPAFSLPSQAILLLFLAPGGRLRELCKPQSSIKL